MEKKENKPKILAEVNLEISEKETERIVEEGKKTIDNDLPKFNIRRTRKQYVTKMGTPLKHLEIEFINEQRARRNSEYTIKHYQRTFLKLYEFCAFISAEKDSISKTYDMYEDKKNPLAFIGKHMPIAALEQDDFQMWFVKYLSDNGANEQTITSYLRDYRAIMYYCMDQGWIDPYKIVIKDKPTPIKDCYTQKELEKLLKKPDPKNFPEYRNWVIVNYLLATGNRIQTIINLKVGDVDLEDGYININIQKNKSVSRISLVSKMVNILREYIDFYRTDKDGYLKDDEYLFVTVDGNKMSDNTLKKAIASYNLSRGVNKTSIHLFRHTFAKQWIMSGGDIVSLQQMLGQKSNKMVQHYSNLYASDIKEKAEQYSILSNSRNNSGRIKKRRI